MDILQISTKSVKTHTAEIYLGFREAYSSVVHGMKEARAICQEYCDEVGLCVSIKPVEYIYTNGNEPGCSITIINYPRFESTPEKIKERAIDLAKVLLEKFNQIRISIVFSDETIMIENKNYAKWRADS